MLSGRLPRNWERPRCYWCDLGPCKCPPPSWVIANVSFEKKRTPFLPVPDKPECAFGDQTDDKSYYFPAFMLSKPSETLLWQVCVFH